VDLLKLHYFVQVVEAGSFSRAAAQIGLAQPSLSRHLAQLESDLGQRLLQRTGRGVAPTEAGLALLAHAKTLLEQAEVARNELRSMQLSPRGRVLVGLPPRLAPLLAVPLVEGFRERFPRALITIAEGMSHSLQEGLTAGRLDVAVLFDPHHSARLDLELLLREPLLLIGPQQAPELPAKLALRELSDYPLVLPSVPNAIRNLVEAKVRPLGIELKVVAEVGAVQTALALVARGLGYSVLPQSSLRAGGGQHVGLRSARITHPEIRNRLVLAVPHARPATRLVRETIELIRGIDLRQLLAGG
jgi:LysR family nitrogen assimilation transcriptional regulator